MDLNGYFEHLNVGLSDDILRLKLHGDFAGAIRLIDHKLASGDLPQAFRNCLIVQREIIQRLPENYVYTKEQALARVQARISDFTEAEFDQMVLDNRIDWIYIQGVPHYFDRFYESLVKTDRNFAARAGEYKVLSDGGSTAGAVEDPLDRTARIMKETGSCSNRIRVQATVRLKDELFKPGTFVRAHLPIPCACDQQSDIRIERVDPPTAHIAPEDAPQRAVCWEETLEENRTFTVEYSYVYTAHYNDVSAIVPSKEQPSFDTQEQAPHIVFTPYLRELVASLTEGLDSPLDKAKAIYDFLTLNVKYSFMRAYFCLENIAESCARNLKGDCGVMALTFITMCRCAGIPARWESGLYTRPDFCGAHDWAKFYIAPYGWLHADVSFGAGAVRENNEARRQFYFGNLDAFRMVANSQFQAGFTTPKHHWRADPYDNQMGEMELEDRGLRYFEFERTKQVLECTPV